MKLHTVFVLASLSTLANSDCSVFQREWKSCSGDMNQNIPRGDSYCGYNNHTFTKVIIFPRRPNYKASTVHCQSDAFPDGIFDCLPFENTKLFAMTDCPIRQMMFDKFLYNSSLDEIIIRYINSSILHTSVNIHHLPLLQYLALRNILTLSFFDLRLSSIPYLKSLKILDFTFNRLPEKPFRELRRLRGLSLVNGELENLPDDFLHGVNLSILDLNTNKLNHFQPSLLRDMKKLKKLNLAHNFLETIDENVLKDTDALEEVSFAYNRIASLPSRLFRATPALKFLLLDHNELRDIPGDIFQGLQKLDTLKLNHNHLNVLPPDVLDVAVSLTTLKLQSNQLESLPTHLLSFQKVLQVIDLSNNKINIFSSSAPFGNSSHLTKINISYNHLKEFLTIDWSLFNLEQLDLSNNLIQQVTIPIQGGSKGGKVFLKRNKIQTVTINERVKSNYIYFLSGNPFNCSCNLNSFTTSLVSIGDVDELLCNVPWYTAGKRVTDFKNGSQLCEMKSDCPFRCKCRMLPNDQVEVDCRNTTINTGKIHLPHNSTVLFLQRNKISSLVGLVDETWSDLTHLYLSDNSLTSLQGWRIPARLKLLAVDGNKLKELPPSIMDMVNKSEDFSIYLQGNDWPCDCQSSFREWIVENFDKIKDANVTYCTQHGTADETLLVQLDCSNSERLSSNCSNMHISISIILCCLLIALNKML